jgi:hypothetical protein
MSQGAEIVRSHGHLWTGKASRAVAAAAGVVLLLPVPWMAAVIITGRVWDWFVVRLARTRVGRGVAAGCRAVAMALARRMLRDERDYPYLYSLFGLGTLVPLLFAGSLALQLAVSPGFSLAALFAYHVLFMGPYFIFFAHVSTLVHKEGHAVPRGLFRPPFRWLNSFFGSFLALFYGHVPQSYPQGHLRIHHKYDNSLDDIITTLHLDRRRPSEFLVYLPQFALYWMGLSVVAYFVRRRLWPQAAKMLLGMIAFYGLGALLLAWDWRFALGYWFLPQWMTVLFLSAVAYTWHAFAEPDDPHNDYVSSVTLLDGHYNVFNEDYHVVHHQALQVHWTENPAHYQEHLDEYRRNFATIFRDTQTFELFFWIVLRRYDYMADHFVDLGGTLTREQVLGLLRRRLQPVLPETERVG